MDCQFLQKSTVPNALSSSQLYCPWSFVPGNYTVAEVSNHLSGRPFPDHS